MSASKAGRKAKMTYTKLIVNIPTPLIQRFDRVCEREGFTRPEAVKQAIRDFIYDYTSENDFDSEQAKEMWKSMFGSMVEAGKEVQQQLSTNQAPPLDLKRQS